MENGVKTVKIKNFKNLKEFDSEINGKSIFLMGDNEVGKSSFIQAVFSILGNKNFPDKPINNDETDANISVEFSIDGNEYIATKKFTEKNPKGYFELRTPDGMSTTSVNLLTDIVGDISFNPFDFIELSKSSTGRKKQVEFIKKLIPIKVLEKIDAIDQYINESYGQRTEINRDIKNLKSRIIDYDDEFIQKYGNKIETQKLLSELEEIRINNSEFESLESQMNEKDRSLATADEYIKNLEQQLKKAKKRKADIEKEKDQIFKKFTKLKKINPEPITEQLAKSEEHNENYAKIKENDRLQGELEALEKESEIRSHGIDESIDTKKELIKEANLPVPGMTFEDDQILINGLVLSEDQISTSKIMEIGVRIQKALNPRLRIMQIPRGESLGSKRMQVIKDFAKDNDYQLFIEMVDPEKKELTIKFIEE